MKFGRIPRPLVGAVICLVVTAIVIALDLGRWPALIVLGVVVAVLAEWLGISAGCISALIATAGYAAQLDRAPSRAGAPSGGPELLAMAVLLVVAVLFGADNPKPKEPQQ